MVTHLIASKGSSGEVLERTIRFELLEEDRRAPFPDDETESKVLRFIGTLVLGCYLVVL